MVHADRRQHGARDLIDHVGRIEPAAKADFEQNDIGRMLREQQEGRDGLDLEEGDRRASIDPLAFQQRGDQFVIIDQDAAADLAEPIALVDTHQPGRGENVDAQAGGFEHRAQIGDRRALAIGAGDMDHRRQLALGMVELREQPVHALKPERDPARVQRGEPRDQLVERRAWLGGEIVHAVGATVGASAASTVLAGGGSCGAGLGCSTAGDLVSRRQSRARVGRRS